VRAELGKRKALVHMKVTYYGHSCFSVVIGGKVLLFDPFITPNELAKGVDFTEIRADYLLLSHAHEDHVADAVILARREGATVISNFEIYRWLSQQGLSRLQPMNLGGTVDLGVARAKMVNAIHSSSLPDGSYGGNPAGWVIESNEGNFYYSGDTALTADMKLIGETIRLNYAVLCVGDTYTMGIDDAIRAAQWVGVKDVLGVHYDTFPPIRIDRDDAIRRFGRAGCTLHLPRIGTHVHL
jgi:L-ascorbate metabolism protein UlaG (beta-lactamase superfamily)